jgi:hypothetical protein
MATLLGVLILLSLILYLAPVLRKRQNKVVKAKQTKAPKVQPKYSADGGLNELPKPLVDEQTPREVNKEPASEPAIAPATEPSHQWQLTKPTIASPTAVPDEYSSEEEEREVFEL